MTASALVSSEPSTLRQGSIEVADIVKAYRLYEAPIDRLKEALHPRQRVYHKEFYALNGVSLKVEPGQCVGIIGLNGSGKSTLLQIIAGVLTPTSGTVTVQGKIAALLELGAGFNPDFSGYENIIFQCSIMGFARPAIDKLIPHIAEFADIGEFINHPVKTYSSGMYVRLAFAVAINVDPDILIVDEALAVGDIRFQAKCMAKIREFRSAGKSLLFVSHDAAAVKSLCNRAYLLDRGRVVDEGDPDHVFNYYNSLIAERDTQKKPAATSKERAQLRQRSGNGKVRVEAVRLLDERGTESETIVSGTRVTLEFTAEIHHDVTDVTFGMLLRDRLGHDIYGTNNHYLGQETGFLPAGSKVRVTFEMMLEFGAGVYTVTIAAHAGSSHIEESYDWLNDATVFRVVNQASEMFVGVCRLQPHFSLQPLGEA